VQIAEERERLGATIGTGASLDRTGFTLGALTPNLAPSIALLADVVRNPKFDPSEVERLRGQQLAAISAEFNNPSAIASRTLWPVLFGASHPYGVPPSGLGDPAAVGKVSRDELAAFHAKWLRPDTARIIIVGDTTLADVTPLLEKSFGDWKAPAGAAPTKTFDAKVPAPKNRIILVDRPKSPQSVIYAGEIIDAKGRDDLVTLRAANEVFGGNFLSRLNMNLRETKGWSYGVRSGILEYLESAPFFVAAPVQADRTGDSVKEIIAELSGYLQTKGTTAEELTRVVNGNVRRLPGSFETSGAVFGGVINIINLGRPDDYYERLPDKYTSMKAADIDAAGRAKIDVAKLTYVIVGDASVVKPQLEQLGLPVEVVPAPAMGGS
jgi:zinc protease